MNDKERVLKMVEDGKITYEEAMRLLEALNPKEEKVVKVEKKNFDDSFFHIDKDKVKGKMIYVRVLSAEGDKVNVNIPVQFVKLLGGVALSGKVQLDQYGVDIPAIIEAVENGFEGKLVEVDSAEGDRVLVEIS